MGTSTDAYLMYGYDLGSPEEWNLRCLAGASDPDWLFDNDEETDWAAVVETTLLASVAFFSETWFNGPDALYHEYAQRRSLALQKVGVALVSHCSAEYPMYVLAAKQVRATRGNPRTLDLFALHAAVADEDLDGKLSRACVALGIKPNQQNPAWLLCSDWC